MPTSTDAPYVCRNVWSDVRPRILVVDCSDGRLQENVDEFLNSRGIQHYDRLFIPGGPGALASSGFELLRLDQIRRESKFLVEAHKIEEVFLIFHGAADGGPAHACCADSKRKLPGISSDEINSTQKEDVAELLRLFAWPINLNLHVYRAEVGADNRVRFISLQS
ncbi:hypothetical protein EON83_09430 [bacterium]|nr:MAG: hypothetical protein EON83_09430 [bacterium]